MNQSQDELANYPNQADLDSQKLNSQTISWQANEFINSNHNVKWYILFSIIAICLILLDIFFFKSYTFSALVVVIFITIIVFDKRPSPDINYTIDSLKGLFINDVLYDFGNFKSFSVIKDAKDVNNNILILTPVKRFGANITAYFPENVGEKIVDILGSRLPMKDAKLDIIDQIIRRIHL